MGVWDTSTPQGSESKSQGDDRIREMKTAIQESLRGQAASGTEAVFPGSAPSTAPVYRYRGLKDTTANRPASGDYGLFFDTTRNSLQRDNGSSWDDIATMIPAGTVMVFYQASAPVGWTKVVTQNDKALRVVSSSGGVAGGTVPLSTTLAHSHTVSSHTHDLGNHTHTTPAHSHQLDDDGSSTGNAGGSSISPGGDGSSSQALATNTGVGSQALTLNRTKNSGSGTSGTPSSNTSGAASPSTDSQLGGALAYVDVILCSKD